MLHVTLELSLSLVVQDLVEASFLPSIETAPHGQQDDFQATGSPVWGLFGLSGPQALEPHVVVVVIVSDRRNSEILLKTRLCFLSEQTGPCVSRLFLNFILDLLS